MTQSTGGNLNTASNSREKEPRFPRVSAFLGRIAGPERPLRGVPNAPQESFVPARELVVHEINQGDSKANMFGKPAEMLGEVSVSETAELVPVVSNDQLPQVQPVPSPGILPGSES